ncbi:hypothetical protein HALLA_20460 (plasmid) [Halostagnicola larsenii XH-48]|uniref:Uncharacterized protein n=1 Tax=Halostagnicola larsenii XH-48 TaxID=797299 RepID=W0JYF7_9EURY|nr:hypothetical protein HALLA_20460 [Halostagnicola larsenii XH-48]
MSLLVPLVVTGTIAASVVCVIVYVDTGRRTVTTGRFLRTTVLGAAVFGGFLLPHVFETQLEYLYLGRIKPEPVLVSPYEWLLVNIATGVLVCVTVLSLYFVGSRYTSDDGF